jgi:hypothetical protein
LRIRISAAPICNRPRVLFRLAAYFALASMAAAFLAGCAGVSRREMLGETAGFALPGEADREPGKATIYVVRPSPVGSQSPFAVFVEDAGAAEMQAGETRGSQHVYFHLGPGKRKILSLAENTAAIEIECQADSVYFLRQDARMGMVAARNALVWMEALEGRYLVKRTHPGIVRRKSFP